jgi:hypothetical protein
MPLKYPDSLEHNNPAQPLIDDGQLAGSFRVVADKTARNAIPSAKRKIGTMVAWTETGTVYRMQYIGADVTDTEWQKDTNWINIAVYNETETADRTIYVATTGNDTTGTGLIGAPYLTIGKALSTVKQIINSGITTTISIGAGTFLLTESDTRNISKISGRGDLIIIGTMTSITSGFTMGAYDATDIVKYAVTGGTSGSWTANQYKFYFLLSTNYYPITHCAAGSLSLASQVTGAAIYQASTILTVSGTGININVSLTLKNMNISLPSGTFPFTGTGQLSMQENYVTSQGANSTIRLYNTANSFTFARNAFSNVNQLTNGLTVVYNGNYFYTTTATHIFTLQGGSLTGNSNVFENTSSSTSSSCIYFLQGTQSCILAGILKFINTTFPLRYALPSMCSLKGNNTSLVIINSTYLIAKGAAGGSDYAAGLYVDLLNGFTVYGAPNTRYSYDNMYEFINPSKNRIITFPTLYPEFECNKQYTWNNNTSGNVVVGKTTQNYHIEIDYMIARGTLREKGTLILTNAADILIDRNFVFDDCGLTLGKFISGTDIQLTYIVDASGNNASVKFIQMKRSMITPLTI